MSDDTDKMLSGGILVILGIIVAIIIGLIIFKDKLGNPASTVPDIVTIEVPAQQQQQPAPNVNIQPSPDVTVQVPAPNVTVQQQPANNENTESDKNPGYTDPEQETTQ